MKYVTEIHSAARILLVSTKILYSIILNPLYMLKRKYEFAIKKTAIALINISFFKTFSQ